MKKLITLTIALFAFTVGNAFAQVGTTDDTNLNVTANIISTGLEILEESALDFGTVSHDDTHTIAFNDAAAGSLEITGEEDEDVYIEVSDASITLTGPGDPIPFNNFTFGTGGSNDATSASTYDLNTAIQLTGGTIFFFVGGDLVVPDGQVVGAYSGTLNVQVSYNSI